MLSTWIESPAKGRLAGPVRAGLWSTVVVGTHPIESEQEVWLEVLVDEVELARLPAYWIENRGINSLWHVPLPPMAVGARFKYRAGARRGEGEATWSAYQEGVVRPNLPNRADAPMGAIAGPEGLVGNRHMTLRIDERGSTYDVYFPTVGLHSDVRPAQGDQPQSRSHFRAIVGGLAVGYRLDWFCERSAWESHQSYREGTNHLETRLDWKHGRVRVTVTDFVATGPNLPTTAGGARSPAQAFKRFRIENGTQQDLLATFGLYVWAEVNGGVGEPLLGWLDGERALVASNRGHGHVNRKLARDATIEFVLALDDQASAYCEAVGSNEAMLLRPIELPAGGEATIDMMLSGAFTGWRGDTGTFDHWLKPALEWFHATDVDAVEAESAGVWREFLEPLPRIETPGGVYEGTLQRSALAAALHADEDWGAIASSYDRGLNAYCWPRDALYTGLALARAGHPEVVRSVIEWLSRVRSKHREFHYWYQKYTIDGWPEWETPSVDQTALLPWALERHLILTGEIGFLAECWPLVEQAARVCCGESGHPGMRLLEDLHLISSAGMWDNRFGAYLFSNAAVVAGLRSAVRLGERLGRTERLEEWSAMADRVWEQGILQAVGEGKQGPGLTDGKSGRFFEARRLSLLRGLWASEPSQALEKSLSLDISLLGPVIPFGLMRADDPRARATAEALLRHNVVTSDVHALTRWTPDPATLDPRIAPVVSVRLETSSLATLWMARYQLELGRATGDGGALARGLSLIDNILERLGPLGLAVRIGSPRAEAGNGQGGVLAGSFPLHAVAIDAILDVAGLEYDVPERRLTLRPVLGPDWPRVGTSRQLRCGRVSYRLERGAGGQGYSLRVDADLEHAIGLEAEVACPGLERLSKWEADPEGGSGAPAAFDRSRHRVTWRAEMPAGASSRKWTWA
jgi:hypothetical protein